MDARLFVRWLNVAGTFPTVRCRIAIVFLVERTFYPVTPFDTFALAVFFISDCSFYIAFESRNDLFLWFLHRVIFDSVVVPFQFVCAIFSW